MVRCRGLTLTLSPPTVRDGWRLRTPGQRYSASRLIRLQKGSNTLSNLKGAKLTCIFERRRFPSCSKDAPESIASPTRLQRPDVPLWWWLFSVRSLSVSKSCPFVFGLAAASRRGILISLVNLEGFISKPATTRCEITSIAYSVSVGTFDRGGGKLKQVEMILKNLKRIGTYRNLSSGGSATKTGVACQNRKPTVPRIVFMMYLEGAKRAPENMILSSLI